MLEINNINVYGLEESLVASGYPMKANDASEDFQFNVMENVLALDKGEDTDDTKRAKKLGNVPTGSGHDNFLKGVIVQFDVTYPQYWTPQFQRYHFADIVSSQSKMHRITKMDISNCCNKYVDSRIIEILNAKIDIYNDYVKGKKVLLDNGKSLEDYNDELYMRYMNIISNTPMGLEMTMRVTTNYLQLKTIYQQRKNHKLKEDWGNFCDFIIELPMFPEFCLGGK